MLRDFRTSILFYFLKNGEYSKICSYFLHKNFIKNLSPDTAYQQCYFYQHHQKNGYFEFYKPVGPLPLLDLQLSLILPFLFGM